MHVLSGRMRRTEAALVLFAAGLVPAGVWLVDENQHQPPGHAVLVLGGGYLGLVLVAHLAVRRWASAADPLILPCVVLLNGVGLVMIHRLDLAAAARAVANADPVPAAAAYRQLVWTAVSVVLLVVVLWRVREHRRLARYGYTFGLVGLVLLALPGMLPASVSEVNGAKLWLRLGPLSLQPGEFAKIAVIVFVAAFVVAKRDLFATAGRRLGPVTFPRLRDLAPLLAAWALAVGVLTLEKELGASLLVFGVVLLMIYLGTGRVSWLVIGLVFLALACVGAYAMFGHVRVRVQVWSNPFADYSGAGYQVGQTLFGLGSGGVAGTGLGAGRPDLVPLANADFIMAGVGEELGLVGMVAVLLVYLLLTLRGLKVALTVRDTFGKLLAGGLAVTVGLQVFIVVGGVTNLIPETGLTTPFMSAGGSSLLANYILVALLIRIGHAGSAVRPQPHDLPPLASARTEVVARPAVGAGTPPGGHR